MTTTRSPGSMSERKATAIPSLAPRTTVICSSGSGVPPDAVEVFGVVGDGVPEFRNAEGERVLVELIARVPDAGDDLLQGEVERVAAGPARGQDLPQGHRFDSVDPFLRSAEHRGDPAPYHVEDRRLVGKPLREVDGAVLDREPGHPANDGFLDFHPRPLPFCHGSARMHYRNRMEPRDVPITLRAGQVSDATTIARMARDYVEDGLRWTWRPRRIQRALLDRNTTVLVAEVPRGWGTEIAGFAIMRFEDERAHLSLLAVHPLYRRRRIARDLLLLSSRPRPARRGLARCGWRSAPATKRPSTSTAGTDTGRSCGSPATTAVASPRSGWPGP